MKASIRAVVLTGALLLAPGAVWAQNDIAALSDEFDNEQTATQWQRIEQVEGWNANQLELFDINKVYKGYCAMMPFTSSWYKDWRGVLLFKPVKGDFVITSRLRVTGRDGKSAPRSQFSLAGLMVRTPRNITPQTWQPGGENYVFVSLGCSTKLGSYQFEYKTTVNSDSKLTIVDANSPEAQLQVARIGAAMILLTKTPQTNWRVLARFHRPDFPEQLQCGMTAYTDWPTVEKIPPRQHNATVIKTGNPDLGVLYDYVRYRRPDVPANLQARNLADPQQVSDADLLGFLGDAADGGAAQPAAGFATGAANAP